jgi:uncharacterized GH25 family protein
MKRNYYFIILPVILVLVIFTFHLYSIKNTENQNTIIPDKKVSPSRIINETHSEKHISQPVEKSEIEEIIPENEYLMKGTVYDKETKKPLSGVLIYTLESCGFSFLDGPFEKRIKSETESSENGSFSAQIPLNEFCTLYFSKDGYAWKILSHELLSSGSYIYGKSLDIYLEKGTELKFRVIDAKTEKGVPEAKISYLSFISGFNRYPFSSESNTEGKFIFHNMPEGSYGVIVSAPGYIPTVEHINSKIENIIRINKGEEWIPFSGKIISSISKIPAANKNIKFYLNSGMCVNSKTDHNGNFRIEKIMPGKWKPSIESLKGMSYISLKEICIDKNIAENIEILFPEPISVKGKVIDSITGKSITKGTIFSGYKETVENSAILDSNGRFELPMISFKNTAQIFLKIPGYSIKIPVQNPRHKYTPDSIRFDAKTNEDLEKLRDVEILMIPCVTVSGIVKECKSKKPISKAIIRYEKKESGSSKKTVKSNCKGNFKIEIPADSGKSHFIAMHPLYGIKHVDLKIPDEVTSVTLDIEMNIPGEISGYIDSEEGYPIVNAEIILKSEGPSYNNVNSGGKNKTYSDENGMFKFSPLQESKYNLDITAKGFIPERKDNLHLNSEIDITLKKGRELSCMVINDIGEPIVNAYITYTVSNLNIKNKTSSFSDENGKFTMIGIPEKGRIYVSVSTIMNEHREKINLPSFGDIVITIPREGTIAGTVKSVSNGEYIQNFNVDIYSIKKRNSRIYTFSLEYGTDGTFSFENVKPGDYEIDIKKNNSFIRIENVTVIAGEKTDLGNILLDDNTTKLNISVTDDYTGEAVEGCDLNIHRSGRNKYPFTPAAKGKTDIEGNWSSDKLTPGIYKVGVNKNGTYLYSKEFRIKENEECNLQLIVPHQCTVRGIVTDSITGNGIRGARITPNLKHGGMGEFGTMGRGAPVPELTITDANGEFLFEKTYPRESKLNIIISAKDRASKTEELEINDTEEYFTITLDPGKNITGRVLDNKGNPLSEVKIQLNPEGIKSPLRTESDMKGTFSIPGISENSRMKITASKIDYKTYIEHIEYPDSREIEIIMDKIPELTIKALYENGMPVTEEYNLYRIYGRREQLYAKISDSEGKHTFQFESYKKTLFRIRVGNSFEGEKEFEVVAGNDQETVTITVHPLSLYTGIILDENDNTVSNVKVVCYRAKPGTSIQDAAKGTSVHSVDTGTGTFKFGLEKGDYILLFWHPEYIVKYLPIHIAENENKKETIKLEKGKEIEFNIFYKKDKKPGSGLMIIIRGTDNNNVTGGECDKDGKFITSGITPGNYTVSLRTKESKYLLKKNITIGSNNEDSIFIGIPHKISITIAFTDANQSAVRQNISIYTKDDDTPSFSGYSDFEGLLKCELTEGKYSIKDIKQKIIGDIDISSKDEGRKFEIYINTDE